MSSVRKKIRPKKAVILAAGLGTRMSPLSNVIPKPLLPVWGKPALEHVLNTLEAWGTRDVLINTHHDPSPIFNYLRNRRASEMRLQISFEPEILGTGGALKKIDWFLDDGYFWMVNSDIAFELNPSRILRMAEAHRPLSVLWMTDRSGPRTVEMKKDMITDFSSPSPGSKSTYTFCGLQLISPDAVKFLPDRSFSSIIDAYRTGMRRGKKVMGACIDDSFWIDIGTHRDYISAHREIRKHYKKKTPGAGLFNPAAERRMARLKNAGVVIDGFASVADNCKIGSGAVLKDSIIMEGSEVKGSSVLRECAAAPGTLIAGDAQRMMISAEMSGDPVVYHALRKLGWPAAKTQAQPFQPRGSSRVYTRLTCGRQRAVAVQFDPERKENALYVRQSRFLERLGIPVPDIIAEIKRENIYIMDDAGDLSLEEYRAAATDRQVLRIYRLVLDSISTLHKEGLKRASKCALPLSQRFNPALYRWERELFRLQFLERRRGIPEKLKNEALKELEKISRMLRKQPDVLLHRDLQSSNILIGRKNPVFIDFQGMRAGPAAYDSASLIFDPYVELPPSIQKSLAVHYCKGQPLPEAAVQRLAQALGAFGRLSSDRSTAYFRTRIPPALKMLKRAAGQCNNCSHILELSASLEAMEEQ